MENEKNIKRFSAHDLAKLRSEGKSRTDLVRVRAKSEAELERNIAADPDAASMPEDWYLNAKAVMPAAKRPLSLRIDDRVLEWFKRDGPGYQTRINAVLLAFVNQQTGKT